MHMTMPTHSAAKWYQRQVRCAAVVGARSAFQRWVLLGSVLKICAP